MSDLPILDLYLFILNEEKKFENYYLFQTLAKMKCIIILLRYII